LHGIADLEDEIIAPEMLAGVGNGLVIDIDADDLARRVGEGG
jgi:hypothetical protein